MIEDLIINKFIEYESDEYNREILDDIKKLSQNEYDINKKNKDNNSVLLQISKFRTGIINNLLYCASNNKQLKLDYLKNLIYLKIIKETGYLYEMIINDLKPIYYHFLDGFLNVDVGNNITNTIRFLDEFNIITNFFDLNLITNLFIKHINYNKDYNTINVTNLINKRQLNYKLNNKLNKHDVEEIFRYSIYAIGKDSHQTSIVNFIKNNKFHILSFNSGFGLEKHEKNNNKFLPYYGICLELIDDDDFYDKNIFKVMKSIFILGNLYNSLIEIDTLKTKTYLNQGTINLYIEWIDKNIKYLSDIFEINENFKDIPLKASFSSNYNSIDFNKNIIDLEDLFDLLNREKEIYEKSLAQRTYYEWSWSFDKIIFYHILIELLDSLEWNEFDISIYNPQNYNQSFEYFKEENVKIDDTVINKNILHYNDQTRKLYINAQESGSCTWFSIYWALIFYFIIIEENHELYINFVKYLNKIFYSGLFSIFSDMTFNKINNSLYNYNYEFRNICNKFIDLNILDKSILLNQRDYLFNLEMNISIEYQNKNEESDLLKRMHDYFNAKFNHDTTNNINNLFAFLGSSQYVDMFKNNEERQIMIYLLYKYNNELCLEFFDDVNMNIDIDDILEKILYQLRLNKQFLVSNSYDLLIDKIIKKQYLNEISDDNIDIDINLILNSLKQLNNTYIIEKELKKNRLNILPNYFNNYYYWVIYINYYINELPNNDNDIYLFILFAHRLNLVYQIIIEFNKFINKVYLDFEDPILIGQNPKTLELGDLIYKEFILKLFNKKFNKCIIKYDNYKLTFNKTNYRSRPNYRPPKLNPVSHEFYKYNINYLNQFINSENSNKLEENININVRSLDDYRKLINFLLTNPKYINLSFNDKNFNSDISLFILFNIHIIKLNKLFYDNILYYISSLYLLNKDYANILCLLLLNKKLGLINEYGYFIENSLFNHQIFKLKLDEINIQSKNKSFYQKLIDSNMTDDSLLKIIIKYNKFFKNAIFINDYTVIFENINYQIIKITSKISTLFNTALNGTVLFGSDEKSSKILFVTHSNILAFDINIINNTTKFNKSDIICKINNIYFNNNKILKFNEYKHLPFIYFIPYNCIHLIYSENNIYKIINFIDSDLKYITFLLFPNEIPVGFQIYEINNNNLLFPQLNSNFKDYSDLCLNFGVNKFNILFINEYKKKLNAYNFNDKNFNLINFNKKEFFKEELNHEKLLLNKLSILNDNNNNLIKFTKDDKNRIIVKLKEKHYKDYSLEKILFKINKCIINDKNISKYKAKFQHILENINHKLMNDVDFLNNSNLNELLTCD